MLYGLETVALTKRQEAEMGVADVKMLRVLFGVTRMDIIRSLYIRWTKQGKKIREVRLIWFGRVPRKDDGYIGRRMLRMELPGNRKGLKGDTDAVREDMAVAEVMEEDAEVRNKLR